MTDRREPVAASGDPLPRSATNSSMLRYLRPYRGLALPPAHVSTAEEGPLPPTPNRHSQTAGWGEDVAAVRRQIARRRATEAVNSGRILKAGFPPPARKVARRLRLVILLHRGAASHREVPSSNIALHSAHCARKVQKCEHCGDMIPRKLMDEYYNENHAHMNCSLCKSTVET